MSYDEYDNSYERRRAERNNQCVYCTCSVNRDDPYVGWRQHYMFLDVMEPVCRECYGERELEISTYNRRMQDWMTRSCRMKKPRRFGVPNPASSVALWLALICMVIAFIGKLILMCL